MNALVSTPSPSLPFLWCMCWLPFKLSFKGTLLRWNFLLFFNSYACLNVKSCCIGQKNEVMVSTWC